MAYTHFETFVMAMSPVIALLVLLGFIRPLLRSGNMKRLCLVLRSLRVHLPKRKVIVNEEVRLAVERRLQEQKVEHFRRFCRSISVSLLLTSLLSVVHIATGRSRPTTIMQDTNLLVGQVVMLIPLHYPNVITAKTMDFWYTVVFLLVSFHLNPWACKQEFLLPGLFYGNAIIYLVCGLRRTHSCSGPNIFAACNILYALSTCLSVTMLMNSTFLCAAQIVGLFLVSLWAYQMDNSVLALMETSVQLEESKEMYAAACALLRNCCDCCVEITKDGVILGSATELGSFLLRGCGRSLEGRRLADLISDAEDRSEFENRLAVAQLEKVALAESLRVKTRDGNHLLLHLELLWFHFRSADGQLRFMVGVRDLSDTLEEESRQATADSHSTSASNLADSTSTVGSENSLGLQEISSMNSSIFANPVMVIVDGSMDGLPITGMTTGFCARVGRPPLGTLLQDILARPKKRHFERWLQHSVRELHMEGQPPEQQTVTLRMPAGDVQADCMVVPGTEGEELAVDDDGVVHALHLMLFNIRQVPERTKSSRPRHNKGPLSGSSLISI